MRRFQAGLLALIVTGGAVAAGQAGPRRDGNWEITVEMAMPNMPGMPTNMPAGMMMPAMKMTQCITKADAADPAKSMPSHPQRGGGPPQDCKVSDYKTEGSKVSWSVACTGAQPMTGHGEMVYAADSYTGTMTMQGQMEGRGGPPMGMTWKYTGKRLGDCNK
jgi:hypothetical protein